MKFILKFAALLLLAVGFATICGAIDVRVLGVRHAEVPLAHLILHKTLYVLNGWTLSLVWRALL
jgi:hypothetical protein